MRPVLIGVVLALACVACAAPAEPISSVSVSPAGSAATSARTSTPSPASPAPPAQAGAISGHLGYPSEFLPGLGIYAISVDGTVYFKVESSSYQQQYTMLGVLPGDYYVYAVARWPVAYPPTRFGAAYTAAVLCGRPVDCADHSPKVVHVVTGKMTPGIDPNDWYAGSDTFPLIPDGPPPAAKDFPARYPSAVEAAESLAAQRLVATEVKGQSECAQSSACFWFDGHGSGHDADYFLALAGSNGDLVRCGVYVVAEQQTWRPLDVRCTPTLVVALSVGAQASVELPAGQTGCVNVRSSPGLSAPRVQCLPANTRVIVDGGPYYTPSQASTGDNGPSVVDLWWHLKGRGWMSHEYLYAIYAD